MFIQGITSLAGVANLLPLGAGGNGDVYAGTRIDTGEPVVVKFLRDPHLPDRRRAFAREVRVLSKNAPHLVPVLWSDLQAAQPYYVMPRLPYGSLTQFAGRMNTRQVERIGVIVADALEHLHLKWIYHGDIKPDNLLLDQNGQTLVADPLGNGCGCTVLFAERKGGTPGYCAPEMYRGAEISAAGDVFSLGATLHHLITGSRPTPGSSFELSPTLQISRHLREAVTLATRAKPAQRPGAKDIKRVLLGESWAQISAQRERNVAIGLGAAATLVLVAFLADGK
jgi:eukaryotic-like serine/threonine-protein kinase